MTMNKLFETATTGDTAFLEDTAFMESDMESDPHKGQHDCASHSFTQQGLSEAHAHDVLSVAAADIDKRLQYADQQCQFRNVRFTPLRRHVYQLILKSDKPIGAYDLIQSLQSVRRKKEGTKAKMVAPPTIYRTLDFLLQLGLIHQLTSINAFVPCCHPRNQHNAVFLLCNMCHRVQECSDLPVREVTHYVKNDLGFQVEQSVMELKGRCQNCLAQT